MGKDISTLVNDIYSLFDPNSNHEASEELLEEFANNLKAVLRQRLKSSARGEARGIRFSMLGKKDRQVWMDNHPDPTLEEQMRPQTYMKFLYGDVIEQLYLYLAKEAGHNVTDEQREVEVNGILGHIDARIDGVVVDVKSASSYGFEKFKKGTVEQDDPFGYVEQLAGYASVLTPGEDAYWLAIDKTTAELCLSPLSKQVIKHHHPEPRIDHLKEVIARDEPPELCYQPVPDGKSGNMKLDTGCSYCQHKKRCFPNVRTFIYSNGPRFLTEVVRTPDVPEVTREIS